MNITNSKNLLVLTTGFPDKSNRRINGIFVKEQVNQLKIYFEDVYVISPTSIWKEYLLKEHFKNYNYDNVHVYYPLCINFPAPYIPKYLKKYWVFFEKTQIKNIIKSEKIAFDLIHAHYTWHPGAVAVELKKDFNVPVVLTEHTHVTLYKAIKREDLTYFRTWKQCDAIIRVNKKDIPLFKKFNKYTVNIPNGFDENRFYRMDEKECRGKLNLPTNRKLILTISNLTGVKGHKYSIKAMEEIIKSRKDVLYIIGGSGSLKDKLQRQINDTNLQNYIKLVGFIPHDKVSLWMNACDLFILPSLSESFGIVQVEAMACGKPVVATYNGGSEEIIASSDYGYLVEPGNSEQLAEKILIALDKEWNEEEIRIYAEQFAWENIAKEIVELYKKVMK